jgi:simple sugar transport system permease protein
MPPVARAALVTLVALTVLSIARVVADAPDMTISDTFAAALGAATPIALAGLGGLFSERCGVVNIGLEGMITLGTWGAGYAGWHWGPWAALGGGVVFGCLGGLLHALATVTFGVDQIVSGVAINIIAPGVTRFLSSELFAGQGDGSITKSPTMSGSMGRFTVPFLAGGEFFGWETPDPIGWIDDQRWFLVSDIAGFLGGFMHGMRFSTMIGLAMIPLSAYVLWRTPFGLRLRSAGEKPSAADSLGVPVYRMRYAGVAISGAMAGLGGAWLAVDVRSYNENQAAGRGFLGLAALIFGNWRPSGIFAGAGLFAYSQALSQRPGTAAVRALFLVIAIVFVVVAARSIVARHAVSGIGLLAAGLLVLAYYVNVDQVNNQVVFITPYLVTLLVLAFASQSLRPPAAAGKAWRKGDL